MKGLISMENNIYVTPLSGRYASEEMNYIWSNNSKYSCWRKLWVALAETEKERKEKFYKCSLREQLCCLHNVRSRKKRNRIPEKLKKKENENLLLTSYREISEMQN